MSLGSTTTRVECQFFSRNILALNRSFFYYIMMYNFKYFLQMFSFTRVILHFHYLCLRCVSVNLQSLYFSFCYIFLFVFWMIFSLPWTNIKYCWTWSWRNLKWNWTKVSSTGSDNGVFLHINVNAVYSLSLSSECSTGFFPLL